jgi:hypothetical protein
MHPSIIVKEAIARLGIRPYPLSLSYELTWLRNLERSYCDRHTPMQSELTRDQIFTVLGEFYDSECATRTSIEVIRSRIGTSTRSSNGWSSGASASA